MRKPNFLLLSGFFLLLLLFSVSALDNSQVNASYNFSVDAGDELNNCDGTVTGATLVTGIYNQAYDFDGVGDDISFGTCNSVDLMNHNYTFNVWAQFDTAEQEDIIALNNGGAGLYINTPSGNNLQFYLDTNTATDVNYISVANVVVTGGSWQMLTFRWYEDTLSADIFVNGTEVAYATEQAGTGTTLETGDTLRLGTYDGSTVARNFDGILDAFTIFKVALSNSDITSLFNAGAGQEYPYGNATPPTTPVNTTNFYFYDSFDGNPIVLNYTVVVSNSTHTFSNSTNTGVAGLYNLTLNGTFNVSIYNPQFYNQTRELNLNVNSTVNLSGYTSLFTVMVLNKITGLPYLFFNTTYAGASNSISNGSRTFYGNDILRYFVVRGGTSLWQNSTLFSTANLTNSILLVNVTSHQLNVSARSYGSPINNFTVNITRLDNDYTQSEQGFTSTGIKQFYYLNGTYAISVNAYGYSDYSANITFNTSFFFYQLNVSLLESTAMNFTFRDVLSTSILTYTTTNLEIISNAQSANYTTGNGTLLVSLLLPSEYILRYSANGYPIHFYYFTLVNRTFNNLNLYLHNNSNYNNVTITVIDEYGDPVENAQVRVSRYYLSTNSDILQEICLTNFEGKCSANMQLNSEFYTFSVYHENELKKSVSRTRISSLSYQISIVTGTPTGEHYFDYKEVDYSLVYLNTTRTFTYFYSDSEAIASGGCLYVYSSQLFGANPSYSLINSSCATGASSTLSLTIIPQNNTQYRADAYVTKGNLLYLGSIRLNYHSDTQSFQKEALILCILLTLVVLFAFYSTNPSIAVALMPLPVFAFTAIGILNLSLGVVTGFYVIILIFAFGIMDR